jgi:two-component system response regulator PilR (NtrC family)
MLAPMGGGERILVVEDEKDICESVCATLREDGYVVVSAATVAEARARIDAESFDAVVLDLWLPDGNGDLVLRALATRPNPPAIVLASAATAAPALARKFGVHCLRKPYDLAQMVTALKTAMTQRMVPSLPPPSAPESERKPRS